MFEIIVVGSANIVKPCTLKQLVNRLYSPNIEAAIVLAATPICATPQQHNTYTPPMAHAWGRSVMIVVMCWLLGLSRQLGEHVSVIQG